MNVKCTTTKWTIALLAVILCALSLAPITPAAAVPPTGSITVLSAGDESFSANAAVLVDGTEGADPSDAWANSSNPWSSLSYPMSAVVDLGQLYDMTALHFYGGQIPFSSTAALQFELSADGVTYFSAATASNPAYDTWSAAIPVDAEARYVRLRFDTLESRFDVTEVAVVGIPATPGGSGGGVGTGGGGGGTGAGASGGIAGLTASNGHNSANADRLVDGIDGPDWPQAWTNPNPWSSTNFPMNAIIDLGDSYNITALQYHVGNIFKPNDNQIVWEYSTTETGAFEALYTGTDHTWNAWREVDVTQSGVRRLRVTFGSQPTMFNLSEVVVFATGGGGGGGQGGGGGNPDLADLPDPTAEGALQATPPAAGIRADAFGNMAASYLSPACRDLHDRYWTTGPDGQAYRTWHPAITYVPETADDPDPAICDMGHEHGYMPTKAGPDVLNLAGGWPPFGYAAEQAGYVMNHESHEGHKVTVANFRAAVGNAANKGATIYDAGFECSWLSKIHQGSFSLDALANSVHEYFLTLSCGDGTELSVKFLYTFGKTDLYDASGCDGHVIAAGETKQSIAAHYGLTVANLAEANDDYAINGYTDINLPPPGTELNILRKPQFTRGFDGNPVPVANRPGPNPNETSNVRGFVCSPGIVWNTFEQLQEVTLWTQPNWIERDGDNILMIQPYYSVIDMPWLITGVSPDPTGQDPYVVNIGRTLELCYNNGVRLYPDAGFTKFCEFGPYDKPTENWESADSPFNGTRRAVNFKTAWIINEGGDSTWCTDPWGRSTELSTGPCPAGQIEQYVAAIDNHWNDGTICQSGVCNIVGSVWATDPWGNTFGNQSIGGGAYIAQGPTKEFVIDNSEPDDNFDGQPDGAQIRGRN